MVKPSIWKYGNKWFCGRKLVIGLTVTPVPVAPLFGSGATPAAAYADWLKTVKPIIERKHLPELTDVDSHPRVVAVARGGKLNMNIIAAVWQRLRGEHG